MLIETPVRMNNQPNLHGLDMEAFLRQWSFVRNYRHKRNLSLIANNERDKPAYERLVAQVSELRKLVPKDLRQKLHRLWNFDYSKQDGRPRVLDLLKNGTLRIAGVRQLLIGTGLSSDEIEELGLAWGPVVGYPGYGFPPVIAA